MQLALQISVIIQVIGFPPRDRFRAFFRLKIICPSMHRASASKKKNEDCQKKKRSEKKKKKEKEEKKEEKRKRAF